MKITKHFSDTEFKCKHCGELPTDDTSRLYLRALCHELELLRDEIKKPIIIKSGYRCPEHNLAVGGVPNSYHLKCQAADIMVKGMTGMELFREIWSSNTRFSGIGIADTYVHVDLGNKRLWTYRGLLTKNDRTTK